MSEYKRWISYIYYYGDGEKKNNIGYARVETRGKDTKLTVHINILSVTKPMKTYLFVRDDDGIEGIMIGRIIMEKGVGHGIFNMETNNIEKSGMGMSEISGIIIMGDEGNFYASVWDDSQIVPEKFREWKYEAKESEQTEREEETGNQQETQTGSNISDIEPEDGDEENKETVTAEIKQEEEVRIEPEEDLGNFAEKMFEEFPAMYPFEDDEMTKCVRIEPQDIGRLPLDMWVLANNSFLLQGYYGYRHLILMKRQGESGDEYLLGVPGIFHNRDDFMAKMFGFNSFKAMRETGNNKGEFGYWYIMLSEVPEKVVIDILS